MESNPNPTHKHGDMNYNCPYFVECTDHAVLSNWEYWTCSECPFPEGEEIRFHSSFQPFSVSSSES